MKKVLITFLLFTATMGRAATSSLARLGSPANRLVAELVQRDGQTLLLLNNAGGGTLAYIRLGLETSHGDFANGLAFQSAPQPRRWHDSYTALHGKHRRISRRANQLTVHFTNQQNLELDVEIRAYDDGLAFRYVLPATGGDTITFTGERTAYRLPADGNRWLQKYVTSYEGDFPLQQGASQQGEWGFPALFQVGDCFVLITESDVDETYCATHLSNEASADTYSLVCPHASEGMGLGEVNPRNVGTWKSPWRLAIVGTLGDVVESTLVDDVARPSQVKETRWIQPGRASWVYWAYNHGTKDYRICCQYVDLAVEMGWEYVLFDWEWDEMTNGGRLEDACRYARERGVKPWLWYNSGGQHNGVPCTPRDRMLTHESRVREFEWLRSIDVVGVKIDFFESDKQHMMQYYLDILRDAAEARMMVNFHGCTVPRGWSRTYPHLMSMEAVFGAEQYNNGETMTGQGARINCLLPYTRNVIGPMDYTPCAFSDSQHPHLTTLAHELALPIVFESGIQHLADRPESFLAQPAEVRQLLSGIPAQWDETLLLAGYPGQSVVMARRTGRTWYIAGLNGTDVSATLSFSLERIGKCAGRRVTLFTDGDSSEATWSITRPATAPQSIPCRPRGGFVLKME